MIHLLTAAAVITAAAIAGLTHQVAGKVVPWRLPRSVLAGLAAAAALTIWVATVRHAALVHSAAQPMSDGRTLAPGAILADGFTASSSSPPRPCSSSRSWPARSAATAPPGWTAPRLAAVAGRPPGGRGKA